MTIYAGLDVTDKSTHICVVGADGAVIRRDVVTSDPEAIAKWSYGDKVTATRPITRKLTP